MTTEIPARGTGLTLRSFESAPQHALAVLSDPHLPLLDAVVWLSAHLSAVEHVLRPELRRIDCASDADMRATTQRIEHLLRALEQQITGDALATHVDQQTLVSSLTVRLIEYIEQERRLLGLLCSRLPLEAQRDMVTAYRSALEVGPTRPHPHAPHGRMLSRLAYRVNGPRDRLMDALDARPIPTPHRDRPPIKPSRWGDYFLGASHPSAGRDDQ